jgi:hypothetical protein
MKRALANLIWPLNDVIFDSKNEKTVPYLFLRGRKDADLLSAEMEHTDPHVLSSELQDLTIVSEEVGHYRRQRVLS